MAKECPLLRQHEKISAVECDDDTTLSALLLIKEAAVEQLYGAIHEAVSRMGYSSNAKRKGS